MMGLFRREPLHERLAREGGLTEDQTPPEDTRPRWGEVGIHGIARPREWDAVVTAEASDVEGDRVDFVALPDGSLLVEEEQGDAALEPLAAAVEQRLGPPYRASGARQTASLWGVSARRIQVAEFEAEGERLEVTQTGEGKTLRADGMPAFGSVPALERLGEAVGGAYAVHAERLDGDLWEVRVARL
jgi:hypothetical protein